jgi:hypothetical protein
MFHISLSKGGAMLSATELKKKAKTMGIANSKLSKEELVRAIQAAEGNYPCFKTAKNFCDQSVCLWRDDCVAGK